MSHQLRRNDSASVPPTTVIDPVCGMTVDPRQAAGSSTHEETTYHFCSKHCQQKFQTNPRQFITSPEMAAIDPVCGMTVDPSSSAGSHAHEGTTYYFCAPGCRVAFEKNPEKYIEERV